MAYGRAAKDAPPVKGENPIDKHIIPILAMISVRMPLIFPF